MASGNQSSPALSGIKGVVFSFLSSKSFLVLSSFFFFVKHRESRRAGSILLETKCAATHTRTHAGVTGTTLQFSTGEGGGGSRLALS